MHKHKKFKLKTLKFQWMKLICNINFESGAHSRVKRTLPV